MTAKAIFLKIGYGLVVLHFLGSCTQNNFYSHSVSLRGEEWHKDSILQYKLPVMDTVTYYDVFINLRNTNAYPYSNLYLITQLNFPHGKQQIDTLQYQMAKPNGEWLGVGATSVKENKLWYLQKFTFSEKGNYSVSLKHAMRAGGAIEGLENLKGISDVGIQIESSTKNNN